MQQTKGIRQKEQLKKELQNVKIGFIRQGTSLNAFLGKNGIERGNTTKAFNGKWNGEKARALRQRIIEASRGKNSITRGETI